MFFEKTFQNINRSRQIIQILLKYGFEDFVYSSPLHNFVPGSKRIIPDIDKPISDLTRWERIRMAAEELGPTFIKLAQVLSNRPDILPDGLITELEKLQNKVPPFGFPEVRRIVEREYGKSIEDVFADFSEIPLASASIGQVHRARLSTGAEVVVKVQRPEVRHLVDNDMSILTEIANRGEKYFRRYGIINMIDVVKTFERSMNKELDYKHEARNIERFRAFYKNRKDFYVPRAYRELTTERVMVIEYASGCKITDIRQLKQWGHDPKAIADRGLDIYLSQIFEHGYFHADPHPGNVLVREDGVICLIDFGMVGKLSTRDKFAFAGIFVGMARKNPRTMAVNLRRLAIEDEIEDLRMLEYDLAELIEDYGDVSLNESSLADITQKLQKIIYHYRMRVPGGVFLIFRALAILEGIGKMIHPDINTMEHVKPYGAKILKQQFSPEVIADESLHRLQAYSSLFTALPFELKAILKKTKKGRLRLEIDHNGYEPMLRKLDRITNRISLTLIIVAMILGSSIIMTADNIARIEFLGGVPVFSLIGLIAAGALILLLFFSVIRSFRD